MTKPQVLVDGDPFCYRAAFSCQGEPLEEAIEKIDGLLDQALFDVAYRLCPTEENTQVFLTGSGNFRYDIAVSYPYKGNRKSGEKPEHLQGLRDHLVDNWGAVISEEEEADDLIGIAATDYGPQAVVVSVDKDMLQLPCQHYNPNKQEVSEVSEEEGLKFFYTQVLTGDRVDNIMGLYRVGPVKASKLLEGLTKEEDLYVACLQAYEGDEDRVIENARLLWLRRFENQLWEPPKCDQD